MSEGKEITLDRLRELTEMVTNNPEVVHDLSPEETIELQKYLNPNMNIATENKTYANLSIVNWTEEYMRKLLMTSLIGYLYRLQTEYEPEEEIEASRLNMEESLKQIQDPDSPAGKTARKNIMSEHAKHSELLRKTARRLILKFLNRNFNFNPDNHLRGAQSENKADPERKPKADAIREACAIATRANTIDTKLSNNPEKTYQYLRMNLLKTYQTTVECTQTLRQVIGVILDPDASLADKQGILMKKYKFLVGVCTDMKKIVEPLSTADTLSAWQVDPPVDVFHQFNRYMTNHYEQLREVCAALYNEKPDIEYSVIFYRAFDSAEAAANHRNQHESGFRAEVLTIENVGVTLIGPFKENRGRVQFYNKNVEVMKRMMEQMETDHKLGKDLMEKKVKKQKKRNIQQDGPDAAGLRDYSKAMNIIQDLGAKKVLTREEQDILNTAKAVRDDAEVPEDAIQVDLFFPKTNADGEVELSKTKFYTAAEAPLHLESEDSEYAGKYQPKRDESVPMAEAYETKTIISKTGEKKTIHVPAKEKK